MTDQAAALFFLLLIGIAGIIQLTKWATWATDWVIDRKLRPYIRKKLSQPAPAKEKP